MVEIVGSACEVEEAEVEGGRFLHGSPSHGDLLLLLLASRGNSLLCSAALGREATLVRSLRGKEEGDQEAHSTRPHHIVGSGPGL